MEKERTRELHVHFRTCEEAGVECTPGKVQHLGGGVRMVTSFSLASATQFEARLDGNCQVVFPVV